jgi:hypothetical protein
MGSQIFPGGAIGAGILLLRVAVAGSTVMLTDASISFPAYLLGIAIVIGLCAGLLTRVMAGLSVLACVAVFVMTAAWETTLVPGLAAAALVLTGPGAYSLDARLFGRRTITLGGRDDTNV